VPVEVRRHRARPAEDKVVDLRQRSRPDIDDETLKAAFDTHLRLTLNCSSRTAETYAVHLKTFSAFLRDHNDGSSLLEVVNMDIKKYLLVRASEGIAPASRANETYALRAFYRYLQEENLVAHDPTAGVRIPQRPSTRTEVYSDDEAERVISWARSQPQPRWRVGAVLLFTLRYTGLRLTELVTLRLDQVNLDNRRISIRGKGDKPRVVPIPPVLVPVLREYLSDTRPSLPSSAYLFANPESPSTSHYYGRYCPRLVQELVKQAGEGAGVSGRHFPHRWRHTYATSLLRHGVDIHKVQRLLGHSAIATTIRYLHLDDVDLADAVDMAFPEGAGA
jgi:integrase/recombinase XerD